MMKTVEDQLDEARAVIAALRVASARLGFWTTMDSAVQDITDILDAEPSDVLAAQHLTVHADELERQSERLERRVAEAAESEDGPLANEDEIYSEIGLLDEQVRDLRAQACLVVRP